MTRSNLNRTLCFITLALMCTQLHARTAQAQQIKVGAEVARDALKYKFTAAETDALVGVAFGARAGWYDTLKGYPSLRVGAELRIQQSRFGLPEEEEVELADGSILAVPDTLTITSARPGVRIGTANPRFNAYGYTHIGYTHHRYTLPEGGLSSKQNHMVADVGAAASFMVFPCHTTSCVEIGVHAETQHLFFGFTTPEQKPIYWLATGIHALYVF
jgi:hypothetical protein